MHSPTPNKAPPPPPAPELSIFGKMLFENRLTLLLASPIIAGQVGQMLMGWVDTMMVGRVGTVPLAGCAFANNVSMIFMVFGFGLLTSVSVLASRAHGSGNRRGTGEALRAGVLLSVVLGIALAVAVMAALPLMPHLGQPPEVVAVSGPFLVLISWSMVPVFLVATAKGYCESLSLPWLPFWVTTGGVGINAALNWVFIFGNLGVPAMGLTGAGVATLLARLLTAAVLLIWIECSRAHRPDLPPKSWHQLPWRLAGTLFLLGLPVGMQLLLEVGAFAAGALLMGWIGVAELAAHQIALTCAATTFMVPLGLSMALTIRVGQSLGAETPERVRPIAFGGILLSMGMMAVSALCFVFFGAPIASWFVEDPQVILLTAQLLVIAGIFQIFDGIQVSAAGSLRGLADVRVPMVITFAAYWLVALPLAGLLAFGLDFGGQGIWSGLAAGLGVAALLLGIRVWRQTARCTD